MFGKEALVHSESGTLCRSVHYAAHTSCDRSARMLPHHCRCHPISPLIPSIDGVYAFFISPLNFNSHIISVVSRLCRPSRQKLMKWCRWFLKALCLVCVICSRKVDLHIYFFFLQQRFTFHILKPTVPLRAGWCAQLKSFSRGYVWKELICSNESFFFQCWKSDNLNP